VIRALVDRIETLEQQVQELNSQEPTIPSFILATIPKFDAPETSVSELQYCHIRDKAIQEFLDGAGI